MPTRRVSPQEASDLLAQGYTYVDVRSVPEFENGRPAGSVNVPLMNVDASGRMAPNPEFLSVFAKAFPKNSKIVLGCQSGNRSMAAARALEGQGYDDLIEQGAGFGAPGGWASQGLPVERGPAPDRDYAAMKAKS